LVFHDEALTVPNEVRGVRGVGVIRMVEGFYAPIVTLAANAGAIVHSPGK
jgi:hypothetical protein